MYTTKTITVVAILFIIVLISGVIQWKYNNVNSKFTIGSLSPNEILEKSAKQIEKQTEIDRKVGELRPDENYITPTIFEAGVIKGKPYQAANNCLPNVLYPINGLGVNYGSTMPSDCKCLQFVQPP